MTKLRKLKLKSALRFSLFLTLLVTLVLGVYFNVKTISDEQVSKACVDTQSLLIISSPSPSATPTPIISKPKNERELIDSYVEEICKVYDIEPSLIKSVIEHESSYKTHAKNVSCTGLMQISIRWHKARASRLGVDDLYDPYGNILLGVDYISELKNTYKDIRLVLMLYNMNHKDAIRYFSEGTISKYATSVLKKAEDYKNGG
jgi:hypothetical protein